MKKFCLFIYQVASARSKGVGRFPGEEGGNGKKDKKLATNGTI